MPSDDSTGAGAHPASHSLTRSSVVLLGRAGRSRTWHEELVLVSHGARTFVTKPWALTPPGRTHGHFPAAG